MQRLLDLYAIYTEQGGTLSFEEFCKEVNQ
jgi:hypothetical protein